MKDKKIILLVVFISLIPLVVNTACSKTVVNTDTSSEVTSCVGCAGITGFGCGMPCWYTEKQSIKMYGSETISGEITYYNGLGCINNTEVKSIGTYTEQANCLGASLDCGEKYSEYVDDKEVAYLENTCLGCTMGERKPVKSRGYNQGIKRLYPNGCYSSEEE